MLRILLPAGRQHLIAHEPGVYDGRAGLDVFGDHGSSADGCAVADGDRSQDVGAIPKRAAAADVWMPSAVLRFARRS